MPDYRQYVLTCFRIFKWFVGIGAPFIALFGIGLANAGRKMGTATQEYVGYTIVPIAIALGAAAFWSLAKEWNDRDRAS